MKASITGSRGFIGGALAKKLESMGWEVYPYPRKDVDYYFMFGSPSSQMIFSHNIDYCVKETINSFLDAIAFCKNNNIKLIYPSSATVYNKNNAYAHTKAALEEIQGAYDSNVLGLRIFAGYGVGEDHKKEYANVIYQFCQQMKRGEQPVIWGDGTQTRDFIYIEDIVNTIVENLDKVGIIDIGTGVNTSLNEIVQLINEELGTDIKPVFVDKPPKYVENTICNNPIKESISIREGIRRILNDKTV